MSPSSAISSSFPENVAQSPTARVIAGLISDSVSQRPSIPTGAGLPEGMERRPLTPLCPDRSGRRAGSVPRQSTGKQENCTMPWLLRQPAPCPALPVPHRPTLSCFLKAFLSLLMGLFIFPAFFPLILIFSFVFTLTLLFYFSFLQPGDLFKLVSGSVP